MSRQITQAPSTMRGLLRLLAGVFSLAIASVPASAQFAAAQDSTLTGIHTVVLNFATNEGALAPAVTAELERTVSLELRKSGLKVVTGQGATGDAVLNVAILREQRSLSSDLWVRIDVEQRVQLLRNGKPYQLVTWYYDSKKNGMVQSDPPAMLKTALDTFLEKWMDMNGR